MTELPPPDTLRWVARRKAAVVAAVTNGVITNEEACRHYQMSEEGFFAWQAGRPVAGSTAVCRFRLNSRSGIDEGSNIFNLHSRSEMSGAIAGLTRSDRCTRTRS
jgi:hypothetical protein